MEKIFSNDLANKIYACIREDRYDDFVKAYQWVNIEHFHEKLIFQAILDDGRPASECKNLQPYINFLMDKKPSIQLLALLIAQWEEVNISKRLSVCSEGDKSVVFKSAIENKNIYVIKQLFNHVDDNVMIYRLFYVGLQHIVKEVDLTRNQCISVLADLCKKCENHYTIKHIDLNFYTTVLNKHFQNEGASSYLKNYIAHKKALLPPDDGLMAYEAPIDYVYNDLPEIPYRLYYPTNLKKEYDTASNISSMSAAQSIYLSLSLEKSLIVKKDTLNKKKI